MFKGVSVKIIDLKNIAINKVTFGTVGDFVCKMNKRSDKELSTTFILEPVVENAIVPQRIIFTLKDLHLYCQGVIYGRIK